MPPIKRKLAVRCFSKFKAHPTTDYQWHNGAAAEIDSYAKSLQKAAQILVGKLKLDSKSRTDWDVCPIFLLYRQAMELHLKAVVGEGSGFLKTPTDHTSLKTTHSLRWLAQIVGQIIKAVGWQDEFTCAGTSSLTEFSALVNDLESFDPVDRAIMLSKVNPPNSVAQYYLAFNGVQFAERIDAVLGLLDQTADALAAKSDELIAAGIHMSGDFNPTIQ